jgi:hypothetical protein
MSHITDELDLPRDWQKFRMPAALNVRLQELLDKQDITGALTRAERREATALTELSEMLSLMKLKSRNGINAGQSVRQFCPSTPSTSK